ncbi:hypothetical protein NQT62_04095 [Limnobacter humi]|uniref:Pilus assembly protein n=1 Tax=Limnobacter humi TaxID=1778671 RepID=A0ABT1WDM8_9BURK|nr:hypothetical protein [Limnobacter humi]MCQ8895623.1 hypothetical protein [Limnobacter humi]
MNNVQRQLYGLLLASLVNSKRRMTAIALIILLDMILIAAIGLNIKQTRGLHHTNIRAQTNLQIEMDAQQSSEANQSAREENIRNRLANRSDLNGLILALESTARAHSVSLSDANQQFVGSNHDTLPHSVIEYTVQGSYPNVLQFVAEAMNRHDALVLSNLSFRRTDPLVNTLQTHLEWVYYYR